MASTRKITETSDYDNPDGSGNPVQRMQKPAKLFRGSIVIGVVALLLLGAVACNLALEMKILDSSSSSFVLSSSSFDLVDESTCSPTSANVSDITYHSGHRYYTLLEEMGPLPPPEFHGDHVVLCNDSSGSNLGYEYCLPISGRKDTPFCTGADRMDLLTQYSSETRCYASVLHMLLVEVYEELQAFGKTPLVVFGSLLGAVRNGSMIPFTEDTDLADSGQLSEDDDLSRALLMKGYHFFFLNIWRVCVDSTHPLAAKLYDPNRPITEFFAVPYLDLYAMEKLNETHWSLAEFGDRMLPEEKVQPLSQVSINGLPFNTVHDSNYFLVEMYGDDYMTPKSRE